MDFEIIFQKHKILDKLFKSLMQDFLADSEYFDDNYESPLKYADIINIIETYNKGFK